MNYSFRYAFQVHFKPDFLSQKSDIASDIRDLFHEAWEQYFILSLFMLYEVVQTTFGASRIRVKITVTLPFSFDLQACVRYFSSNYFSPNGSPSKTMKNAFYFI